MLASLRNGSYIRMEYPGSANGFTWFRIGDAWDL